jgi:hypothetical protein
VVLNLGFNSPPASYQPLVAGSLGGRP